MPALASAPLAPPQRQVHLDFHTSPFIPGVASEFDADKFARTFAEARVNSVTVFAKCHHGMCYYPSKTGPVHPELGGRDLMGEQIAALHKLGIRAPIYYTVGWEEAAANAHPEWRQMMKNGAFCQIENSADGKNFHPGRWKFLNWMHPEYQDLMLAQIEEILDGYDVDGFFFDIVFFDPRGGWSDSAREFREKRGFLSEDFATHRRFELAAQDAFIEKFNRRIRARAPAATVFYNGCNNLSLGSPDGWLKTQSHIEIESLPSGFWGYQHFPRVARYVTQTSRPWIGQTGRFQKMWGDFGGIKPQAALEYECFRTQAMGGACGVGDQLPPRGTLDQAAYKLIGAVYAQVEAAEPFYAGAAPFPRIGIVSPTFPGCDEAAADKSLEGAVLMCEEAHYDCAVLKDDSDFETAKYELLILPDSVPPLEPLLRKLDAFRAAGGKLLLSCASAAAAPFLPLAARGANELYPSYWRAKRGFMPELADSDRVFYQQGMDVIGGKGTRVLVDRVPPYFKRSDLKYSSHFQTPPVAAPGKYPAVIAGDGFIYFADPIFREYRQSGNIAARDVWKKCVEQLIGAAPFGGGLPKTMRAYPMRRGDDLIVTLLHYIPERKALDIDMIEERGAFAGETFCLTKDTPQLFAIAPDGVRVALEKTGAGAFALPAAKGRLLLEAPGYFN